MQGDGRRRKNVSPARRGCFRAIPLFLPASSGWDAPSVPDRFRRRLSGDMPRVAALKNSRMLEEASRWIPKKCNIRQGHFPVLFIPGPVWSAPYPAVNFLGRQTGRSRNCKSRGWMRRRLRRLRILPHSITKISALRNASPSAV